MPTNLPAEYKKVEERYKAASTPEEKVRLLEEMISTVPKHKGTDKLRADLRRRLSKLKASDKGKKKTSRHVSAFHIDPEGAGQVVLIGSTNVGKSALVTALTNASPEVADHPFTTWSPAPGMMNVGGAQIQLVDTPPLNPDYVEPAMMDLIRRADLILLIVDLQGDPIGQLEESLNILEGHNIRPQDQREESGGSQGFISVPIIVVANKNDDAAGDGDFEVLCELLAEEWPSLSIISVSATTGRYLDDLGQIVFDRLQIIRVYTRPPYEEADLSAPYVMAKDSTVEDFAAKVHKDFFENLKSARIWGSGVFEGQPVGRDYILQDGDVVELRI